ncbi:two-component system LytT family response regulator [Flavobacterium nitrogenifigens]|uniref:Two-component system LytT family response regulator n=2 Tax=Flavobacterium TaxID=237 RepID=A0A7W7IXK3_9FLAO|nr:MULTISPECIES: LytTR family DNA-binding domain-containing protein [Flavobacterium]MBB4802138.1 two-component system LytT family response regulator [Flavobacterium nitrogenifigens]MBB6387096.1 two-component system LytT family response regulator [Flavobacterium notoginsengisoli]
MTNILIIEDEAKAARELSKILYVIDDTLNVAGTVDSIEQAVEWFSKNEHPDLIFSDIQLADGLCFEIFERTEIKSPVIFCTAFDDYMMNAFETNGISYILKPISRQKVEKALEKFELIKSLYSKDGTAQTKISDFYRQIKNYKTALLVNQKEKIIPIQVREIAFYYLDKSGVTITTLSNQKYFISSSMDEIENFLDPQVFYRANRQFLINRAAIVNAERYFARKLLLKLCVSIPETIIVSKAKASDFLHWLEGN